MPGAKNDIRTLLDPLPPAGAAAVIALLAGCDRDARQMVGVSGGRDSVCLLDILVRCGFRNLIVCHLNHLLRGREAAKDAQFVARLAKRFGLVCELGEADVAEFAKSEGVSLEEAGRACRHRFFGEVAGRHRCRRVFLGHHADDRVETMVFNLVRGTGLAGLGGIQPVTTRRVGRRKLEFVRPLLPLWRAGIDAYVAARNLRFRDDATNRDIGPSRNRLRHVVIPAIERELGRNVRESLGRAAGIVSAEDDYLSRQVDALPCGPRLEVKALRALDPALRRRLVFRWLRARGVRHVGFATVERVLSLFEPASENAPAKVNLPGKKHARRRQGEIFVEGAGIRAAAGGSGSRPDPC